MFIWRRISSWRNRALFMVTLPLLSILSLFTPLFSSNVSAITPGDMQKKAEVWVALAGIVMYPEDLRSSISASDASSCRFLEDQNSVRGAGLNSGNLASIGKTCADMARALGYKPPSGSQSNYTLPDPGNRENVLNSLSAAGISSANMFYGGNLRTGVPSDAIAYAAAYNFLTKNCSVGFRTELLNPIPDYNEDPANNQRVDWMKEGGTQETPLNDDEADTAEGYHFWMWTYNNGKVSKNIYWAGSSMDDYFDVGSGAKFLVDYQTGPRDAEEPWQADCYQAGRLLQDNKKYADAYAAVLKPGGNTTPGTCLDRYEGQAAQLAACDDGFKNKGIANYCQNKYPAGSIRDACIYGAQTATGGADAKTPPPSDTGNQGGDEETSTCDIPGIGWIVCPVVNFLASLTDAAYRLVISNLLEITPLTFGSGSPMFQAWSVMRNFANVAFVIVFLIIIFSQITGAGISNYGIKKMLPRLIVGAILVNVSYYICAIAVDLSNILGSSIYQLLVTVKDNAIGIQPSGGVFSGGNTWANVAGSALVIGGAALAIFYVTLAALLPILVTVLATIITVFLALILRQALIVILIVISPLAFVALLLPNTESLFKKWRSFLQLLLLMYPIIGLVFGGAGLASAIIIASSSNDLVKLAGAAAAIIPLVVIPAMIGAINKVFKRVGLPQLGVNLERTKKAAEGVRDNRQHVARKRRFDRAAGKRGIGKIAQNVGPPGSRRQRVASWIAGSGVTAGRNRQLQRQNAERGAEEAAQSYVANRAASDQAYAEHIAGPTGDVSKVRAAARAAQVKEFNDAVNAEKTTMSTTSADDLLKIVQDNQASETRRAAAAGQLMKVGKDEHIHKALDYLGTQPKSDTISSIQQQVAADMGTRKPTSLGAGDMSALTTGTYSGTFESKISSRLTSGKLSGEALAKTSADELDAILAYASDPANQATLNANPAAVAALKKDINTYRNNPNVNQPAHEIADKMDNLYRLL